MHGGAGGARLDPRRGLRLAMAAGLPLWLAAACAWSVPNDAVTAGAAPALPFVGAPFGCVEDSRAHLLPPSLSESSGIASGTSVLWSHNDSGHPAELFALDPRGRLLGVTRVSGARNVDWEDLASGPCPTGGHCLYIADVGDNLERRTDPAIYRIPEPDPADSVSAPAERFPLRLPDGPRDIEAMYLLPGERLFLVTKGRNHPVELYRVPPLSAPDHPLNVERVQTLTPRRPSFPRLVTGAGASADGRIVAVRTYETLEFFVPLGEGSLAPIPGGRINLRPLREPQGEAVAILPGGRIVLTSEAGPGLERGALQFLSCPGLLDELGSR